MGYIYGYAFMFIFLVVLLIRYMAGRYIKMINTDEVVKEADQYVRDHLLIEWMQNRYYIHHEGPEEVYSEWNKWLKEKEKEHE